MADSPIKLVSMKCPDCGASLSIEPGRSQAFCSYCGAKIIVSNENEYVQRTVDEAKIKQAEAQRDVQLKQLELEENNRKRKNKTFAMFMIGCGIFILICIITGMILVLT